MKPTDSGKPDLDRFRLRRFLELLEREGELEICSDPLDLIDVAGRLDGNPRAVLFRTPGGSLEMAGNVVAARRRLALAFEVSEDRLLGEILRRLKVPLAPVEVCTGDAPVHQVVLTGADADFTLLPIHLQHGEDAGPYISASMDFSESIDRKRRNVGYRRMMIRGRKEAGIDMIAPSDLRAIYSDYVARKERLPVAFAIGSHPADGVAAMTMLPVDDEIEIIGALRGAPVPLVRCVTIDAMAPADAEIVLEGYLDERGWCEPEGPFGEYIGYYGMVKTNPVFHLTAITMRRDAVFQTATIGGRYLGCTDTAMLNAIRTEATAWNALETAVREPLAVYCTSASGGMFNLRVCLRQRYPGEARNAIAAVFGSMADVKHVFVVDDDIDIRSDEQMEWALATRFQADRSLVVASALRAMPLDPSLHGSRLGAKAGFDLTISGTAARSNHYSVATPPLLGAPQNLSVEQALASGPRTFRELMELSGSRDGRDVLLELDRIRATGALSRAADGRHCLKGTAKP